MTVIKKKTENKTSGLFLTSKRRETVFLCCMLALPVAHFFVFWLYVNFDSILLAFQNNVGEYIGWGNFKWFARNFASNPAVDMGKAVLNTCIFWGFNMFVELPIAVILSYFFFKKLIGHKVFRVILYLPCIISPVVMTTVFKNFIASDGPLNMLWKMMGGDPLPKFLYSSKTAMSTLLVYNLWTGYGINIILFSGAMIRIPTEIFESARLDGISPIREITSIIIPLIWPLMSTMIILSIAGIFGSSGPILLFTKGNFGTMTIAYAMFQQFYEYNQIARAAAIGLVFTVIGLPLVLCSRWLLTKAGSDVEY